jgi:hypothetical protein
MIGRTTEKSSRRGSYHHVSPAGSASSRCTVCASDRSVTPLYDGHALASKYIDFGHFRERSGLGGPGSLPTRGSHRPVRARIRAYGSSDHGFAAYVITHPKLERPPQVANECHLRRRFRQRCYPLLFRGHDGRISMHSSCFSRGFHEPTPRFPPRAPVGDRSPASTVLSRRYDLLPPISPHFVAFVWRYLRVHSFGSLPGGRVRRRSLELVTR